jgi:hypothetical protein
VAHIADAPAVLDRAGDIGQLPPASFSALSGRLHHDGIETDPTGDGEHPALSGDRHLPEVDPTAATGKDDIDGLLPGQWDAEVSGEEVARPHRYDPETHLRAGQRLDDLAHGAVAAPVAALPTTRAPRPDDPPAALLVVVAGATATGLAALIFLARSRRRAQ